MATELGKAYVQIIPSAEGISGSISQAIGGEATSAGKSAGLNLVGALKGVIAAAGIGAAIKSSLDAGGALQQSFGGLDTIYGDAAKAAKEYAAEASKAGISANSYAEQAVSFGAALKQAYGGDTAKAVEAANIAILDMTDNAAKMGTPIENIQNAYQGFAKSNYTMLDNLKLGYGGTKTEMERLLADATKLSGVEYDISNLGDVYDAIHVIQEDLGLTGVAAAEASTTFTGSFGAMKAAAENLLANLALGEDITEPLKALIGNASVFLTNNLLPMLGNIISAVPTLLSSLASEIIAQAPAALESIMTIGSDVVQKVLDGVTQAPQKSMIMTDIVNGMLTGIVENLPGLLQSGVEIVTNVVNGILTNLPSIIETAGTLITQFASTLISLMPTILQNGVTLVLNLVSGIIKSLPQIIAAVVKVIASFTATILQNLPQIYAQGINMIGQLIAGLIRMIPDVIRTIISLISDIVHEFGSYDWMEIGWNILIGIKDGILSAVGEVIDAAVEAAQGIWDAVTGFFDIHSPSRKMAWIGEMQMEGLANGISDNADLVDDAISDINTEMSSNLSVSPKFGEMEQSSNNSPFILNMTVNGADGQSVEDLVDEVMDRINTAVRQKENAYA